MKGTDRDLKGSHRAHQFDDMMRLIPEWIEQREDPLSLQDKIVINLMVMHVVLLTTLVVRW